jgi:hypothetical protein
MIILRQKSFAYIRELGQLKGTGSIVKDIFSTPSRLKKVRELGKKSQGQWQKVVEKNAPGTKRREIADRVLLRRMEDLEKARTNIERRPWA